MLPYCLSMKLKVVANDDNYIHDKINAIDNKVSYVIKDSKKAVTVSGYLMTEVPGLEDLLFYFDLKIDKENYSIEDLDNDLQNEGVIYQGIIEYLKYLVIDGASEMSMK